MNTIDVNAPVNITVDFDEVKEKKSLSVLPNEIKGVETEFLFFDSKKSPLSIQVPLEKQYIYIALKGAGSIEYNNEGIKVSDKSLFVPKPGTEFKLNCDSDCTFILFKYNLKEEEIANLDDTEYPVHIQYEACEKYRDYFKSEKTVSRTLVHPFVLPRFSLGSVETTGVDRVEPHAHPILDQYFFSFPENQCTLLVDGEEFPYGPNNLLHIPLGSDHGVDAKEGDVVHYLWVDFFENQEDQQYLVDVHKPVEE
ncbi:hypothetical protein MHTCC0001_03050 [Flavobacteriaceae bacterium MHTCC 0001]